MELLVVSTAVGIFATVAIPWLVLSGTFQSWRIQEWHTFWRGDGAFLLESIVAPQYAVQVEFGTAALESLVHGLYWLGCALTAWHLVILLITGLAGVGLRARSGISRRRLVLEVVLIVLINVTVLYVVASLLALPSSLSPKIDFRSPSEIHTDSLIWSDVEFLPLAPVAAIAAVAVQVASGWSILRRRQPGAR